MLHILTNVDPVLLLSFIGAGLLLNITPGADFVFVSASGIAGGPGGALSSSLRQLARRG